MQRVYNDTPLASHSQFNGCSSGVDRSAYTNLFNPGTSSNVHRPSSLFEQMLCPESDSSVITSRVVPMLTPTEAIAKIEQTLQLLIEGNNIMRHRLRVSAATYGPIGALLTVSDELILTRATELHEVTAWLQMQLNQYTESKKKRKLLVRSIEIRIGSRAFTRGFPSIDGDLVAPDRLCYDADDVTWEKGNLVREQYWSAFRDLLLIGSNAVAEKPVIKVRTIRQRRTQPIQQARENDAAHAGIKDEAVHGTPATETSRAKASIPSGHQLRASASSFSIETKKVGDIINTVSVTSAAVKDVSNLERDDISSFAAVFQKLGTSDVEEKTTGSEGQATWSNPLPSFGKSLLDACKIGNGTYNNDLWSYKQTPTQNYSIREGSSRENGLFKANTLNALNPQSQSLVAGIYTSNEVSIQGIGYASDIKDEARIANINSDLSEEQAVSKDARIAQYWEQLEAAIGFESDDDDLFLPDKSQSKAEQKLFLGNDSAHKLPQRPASTTHLSSEASETLLRKNVSGSHGKGRSIGGYSGLSPSDSVHGSNMGFHRSELAALGFNSPAESYFQHLQMERARSISPQMPAMNYMSGPHTGLPGLQQRVYSPQARTAMESMAEFYGENLQHLQYGGEITTRITADQDTLLSNFMNYTNLSNSMYRGL